MLLVIDVGNTNITLGGIPGKGIDGDLSDDHQNVPDIG